MNLIKIKLNLTNNPDAFWVHGLGGITGTLLVAFLAADAMSGAGVFAENGSALSQFGIQAMAARTAVMTFLIVQVTGWLVGGIRVNWEDELAGLNLANHREKGYDF